MVRINIRHIAALVVVCLVVFALRLQSSQTSEMYTLGFFEKMATLPPPKGAIVAKTMDDIEWGDSEVYPRGKAPNIRNIQCVGPGHFKFILRHRHKEGL